MKLLNVYFLVLNPIIVWHILQKTQRTRVLYLKGVCHEIFNLHFFLDSTLSGPLINRLKYSIFEFGFNFADSTPRLEAHRRDLLRGEMHTAEFF